jgi:hypothetical protein
MEQNHNINLNCKGKCPKCDDGELLPFLRARYKNEESYRADKEFDHYEVYYRCSNCNHQVEGDSFF